MTPRSSLQVLPSARRSSQRVLRFGRLPVGCVRALAAGILLASCAGDQSGPSGGGNKVAQDGRAAVRESVTVAGATLTATSHGVTYTLTIPAGAVKVPTPVTMTPVTAIEGLPVTLLVGAVDLQPQGLVLGKPATLRIAVPHAQPAGTVLVGFGYEGDADSVAALLPVDSAAAITLSIHHFSGGGAAFATFGQIQTLAPASPSTLGLTQDFVDSMFNLTLKDPREFLAEQNLMRAWFATVVLPAIQNAGSDVALLFAMSEYNFWRVVVTPGHLIPDDPLFAPERDQFAQAALPKLQEAVALNNDVCKANRDIDFANNVLYWQSVAEDLGLATVANGLDREGVLTGLCIHVRITDSTYPSQIQPQQTGSLNLLAGLQYGVQPNLDNMRFTWRLDVTGSTADGTVQGLSAADGSFTQTIAPSGQGSLVVTITACLNAAEVPYADVCATGNLVRNFSCGIVHAGDITITDSIDLALAQNIKEIQGRLVIQNSRELAMNFSCLQKVQSLAAQASGPGILNLSARDDRRPGRNVRGLPGLHPGNRAAIR